MGNCEEIVIKLRNIEQYLNRLTDITERDYKLTHDPSTHRGQNSQGWSLVRTGQTWFYEQNIVFTGAAQNINLDFTKAVKLRLIEQIFSDATSRDFSIKKSTPESITQFTQLSTQISNVALSELDYDLGSIVSNGRLQFTYSNTTADKTVQIRVTAEEINGS